MTSHKLSRRQMLRLAAGGVAMVWTSPLAWSESSHPERPSGAQAMQWLKEGNLRFSSGRPRHQHQTLVRAKELATGQHPFATILGCSDSRVSPEVIFDQGLGDLFIVRVAGNVISDEVLGSIEYAALHLGTNAFLVLGHEDCGAVKAALSSKQERGTEPAPIQALLAHIDSGIHDAQLSATSADRVTKAVEANAKHSAAQLKSAFQDRHLAAEAVVQTAIYEVGSGKVRWL